MHNNVWSKIITYLNHGIMVNNLDNKGRKVKTLNTHLHLKLVD